MPEMFDDDGRVLAALAVTGVMLGAALRGDGSRSVVDHWYVTVISSGPLVIVRLPWPSLFRKTELKAYTELMKVHGRKQRDIVALEGLTISPKDRADAAKIDRLGYYEKQYDELVPKLDAVFAGGPGFEKFWLYAWEGDRSAGRFV